MTLISGLLLLGSANANFAVQSVVYDSDGKVMSVMKENGDYVYLDYHEAHIVVRYSADNGDMVEKFMTSEEVNTFLENIIHERNATEG